MAVEWQKKEWMVLLICLGIGFIINVVAVVAYSTPWYEMFTQIGFVSLIAGVLYVLTVIVRLLWWLISRIARRTR